MYVRKRLPYTDKASALVRSQRKVSLLLGWAGQTKKLQGESLLERM